MRFDRYKASTLLGVAKLFNAVLNQYCPFAYCLDFLIFRFELCTLGNAERTVAFYDMENDALEEDGMSYYKWDGEKFTCCIENIRGTLKLLYYIRLKRHALKSWRFQQQIKKLAYRYHQLKKRRRRGLLARSLDSRSRVQIPAIRWISAR